MEEQFHPKKMVGGSGLFGGTQRYWIGSTSYCAECQVTRGVITFERIVEAAARMAEVQRMKDADIAKAKQEVVRTEKTLESAKRALADLRAGTSKH